MRFWVLTSLAFAVPAYAVAQQSAPDLQGLWVTKNRYGPDIRGTLRIVPRGGNLVADIAGLMVPVQQTGRQLSFIARSPPGRTPAPAFGRSARPRPAGRSLAGAAP